MYNNKPYLPEYNTIIFPPKLIIYNGRVRGGCHTFVYRNLNVFCIGTYLKIEDFEEGGVSYVQVNLVIL